MAILERYEEINNVVQKRPMTGCIPWAIEWMISYKGVVANVWKIPESQLGVFQYKYDLESLHIGTNSFQSIKAAIEHDYHTIRLEQISYQTTEEQQKFQHIERLLQGGTPCIMPIKLSPQVPTHVMPIVEVNTNYIRVIWSIVNNNQEIQSFPINRLVMLHSQGLSGNNILFLQ